MVNKGPHTSLIRAVIFKCKSVLPHLVHGDRAMVYRYLC